MDLGIHGETALVLGGTQGLGLACAVALKDAGVRLLVNGRSHEAWQQAQPALQGAVFVQGDLGDTASREAIIHELGEHPAISILVTNAGGPPAGRFEEISSEQWQKSFETSVLGILHIVRHVLPGMKARGFGRILNITSFVVKELYPNMSLSNSLRVALTGAMGSIARECAASGVTINNLLPGLMDTGALQRVIRDRSLRSGRSQADTKREMAESVPMKRLGTAADFGPLCAFLASRQAGYITGQNICVDGGLTKSVI